ncbi:Mss4-like protein [Mycena metata]|uniref:Mss4-like protein n=1 Tax=Mycena metata TaxID=1033252 RepID=A0AAD7NRF8_9AGAR|nr:Mss4-like protein [Mycena metata]
MHPKFATGGCVCGGVRYRIDFAPEHDWKRGPHTCQCTQCRKMSGTLVLHFHTVQTTEITWVSKTTYAEYNSSADFFRAFCNRCGSSIAWMDRSVESNMEVELMAGTFDEEFLVGDRDEEDKPLGAYATALVNPNGDHFHVRNEIQGITDKDSTEGTRFWKGSKEGAMDKTKSFTKSV